MSSNVRRSRRRKGRSENVYDKAGNKSLFTGVKAWFSSSVDHSRRVAWINHGGSCCHWKDAQLLFSDNQEAADTAELFEQMEFLWGYVTVFHSSFISACVRERDMKNVVIAPFLMLPPEFPLVDIKDIPSGISQIVSSSNESNRGKDQEEFTRPPKRHKRRLEFSQQKRVQSVLCNTKKHHSTTFQTKSMKDPCCEKSFRFCNGVEEDCTGNDAPFVDFKSIPHVSSLKKTSLRLSDFVPFQSGCAVSRKV